MRLPPQVAVDMKQAGRITNLRVSEDTRPAAAAAMSLDDLWRNLGRAEPRKSGVHSHMMSAAGGEGGYPKKGDKLRERANLLLKLVHT